MTLKRKLKSLYVEKQSILANKAGVSTHTMMLVVTVVYALYYAQQKVKSTLLYRSDVVCGVTRGLLVT